MHKVLPRHRDLSTKLNGAMSQNTVSPLLIAVRTSSRILHFVDTNGKDEWISQGGGGVLAHLLQMVFI
jgi:hypothetical protein